ncbi:MAG: ASKHA domain-containing protein [Defluviitaleaceae bacterium]|nr:ASKHA domain-containing protein [Defluviitaleaceae bacterium]
MKMQFLQNETILDALQRHKIHIDAPCGGRGICKKCTVKLNGQPCLACQTRPKNTKDNHEVVVANEVAAATQPLFADYMHVLPMIRLEASYDSEKKYGLAIDIGTTTLAFELLDLRSGARIAAHSRMNSQRAFGADVLSRITRAVEGDATRLHEFILEDIRQGIAAVSHAHASDDIIVAIAGNTTMLHLLQNLPCDSLGIYPFTPVSVEMTHFPIFNATLLPCISAFVGADIVAGLLHCGYPEITGYNLLIDLGTNGEMTLFNPTREEILVTSTAVGPAFEGGNISQGMASVSGAIAQSNFSPEKGVFIYKTVDGKPPKGICGTGVIDIAAEITRNNLADETGRLRHGEAVPIAPDITFTQKDLREVQLAKSAVRAGIEILLDEAGLIYENLQKVFLAGGFGYKMDIENAFTLGLLPTQFRGRVTAVGNSSLGGCAKFLQNPHAQATAKKIAASAKEITLSEHPRFSELFTHYI